MSGVNLELQGIDKGPNCADCPAVTRCPAMLLADAISELNIDLKDEMLPDEIKLRVFGEYFAYGIKKYQDTVNEIQTAVNVCKGAVRTSRTDFMYPSFKEEVTPDDGVKDGIAELRSRGFLVETIEKNTAEHITSVTDPNTHIGRHTIGYDGSAGLRGVVSRLRQAASYQLKIKK